MVDCNRICIPLFVSTSRSIHHSWLINGFLTRVNRSLNCLQEHTSSTHGLRAVHAVPSLVFCVVFCRLLFVHLTFFVWSLCFLFFFDWRIMITPFDIFKLFVSFKNFPTISTPGWKVFRHLYTDDEKCIGNYIVVRCWLFYHSYVLRWHVI